ncbi:MAG: glycosyltransferase [Pseudomonadales bacterium]|nr:glycosyltransferase [Pseudomonadales bacterium]
MLERFLDSFIALSPPEDAHVSLLVVENNHSDAMRSLIEKKQNSSPNPIFYHLETKLGIPIARNTCLKIARAKGATHVAFTDDDEWLAENWLTQMWKYMKSLDSNHIVQGPVISVLPASAPGYLASYFQRQIKKTGTKLNTCATNNLLAPIALFEKHELTFDESRPLAGGSDTKVFSQANSKGVNLVFYSDALVYEAIPSDRANMRWLTRRYFRIGLDLGTRRTKSGRLNSLIYAFNQALKAISRLIKAGYYSAKGNKLKRSENWLKACKTLGCSLSQLGIRINSYSKVEGY